MGYPGLFSLLKYGSLLLGWFILVQLLSVLVFISMLLNLIVSLVVWVQTRQRDTTGGKRRAPIVSVSLSTGFTLFNGELLGLTSPLSAIHTNTYLYLNVHEFLCVFQQYLSFKKLVCL